MSRRSHGSFMKRAPRSYANSLAREFHFSLGKDIFKGPIAAGGWAQLDAFGLFVGALSRESLQHPTELQRHAQADAAASAEWLPWKWHNAKAALAASSWVRLRARRSHRRTPAVCGSIIVNLISVGLRADSERAPRRLTQASSDAQRRGVFQPLARLVTHHGDRGATSMSNPSRRGAAIAGSPKLKPGVPTFG